MISTMRKSATNSLVAVALAALSASGPAQAVSTGDTSRVGSLAEIVAELPEQTAPIFAPAPEAPTSEARYEKIGEGVASYYGHELAGNRTASGERFNPAGLTAAHRSLPLGTKLRVTNQHNGDSVVVRVNDRGPFVKNRLIDVSLGAAREIGMVRTGTARVTVEIVRAA
jgi:rare lipoprotein A